jgi:hypothetical protein
VTLEARRSPLLLLLLLLLLVPLGVITPRWWWWRRDRRIDAPLRAVGLRAGHLGPTCSPLTLLRGSKTSDPSARRSLRRLSSSDPPELPGAEALLVAPLPLPKGLGPRWGWRWEPHQRAGDLQPVHRRSGSRGGGPDHRSGEPPRRCHRGSAAWPRSPSSGLGHRRAQGCLGEYQGFRDKSIPVIPPPGVPARPRTDWYSARAGSYRCRSGR